MLFNMGPSELGVIGVLAVLLFGKRLPEVARQLGGSYKQFRKGLSDMQAQLNLDDTVPSNPTYYADDYDDYEPPTAPKFEPPESEPSADTARADSAEAEEV